MSSEHLPNFIVIGPGKSGTSWLYHILGLHPQVCMSSAKETLYFEDYYKNGPGWYSRFFRQCVSPGCSHAIGEISNTYIFSPEAASRIAHDFPAMRLIATLRDPTERAFSHYLFIRRNGQLQCSFDEALRQRPDLKARGNYFQHLQPYRQLFPAEQLAIYFFDDFKADVEAYAARLFDFLQVDMLPDKRQLHVKVLEASQPRNPLVARTAVAMGLVVRRLGFPDIVTRVKQGWLSKVLFKPMKAAERPQLTVEAEQELREYYVPDLERLSVWLGRDVLKMWGPGATISAVGKDTLDASKSEVVRQGAN